jgi:hypothetical protein
MDNKKISYMKKLFLKLSWRFLNWIGYVIVFRDYYDPETFTLVKKNTHMVIHKCTSKTDANGWRNVKQIFEIQIRKI